jgi:hypothetical protein
MSWVGSPSLLVVLFLLRQSHPAYGEILAMVRPYNITDGFLFIQML